MTDSPPSGTHLTSTSRLRPHPHLYPDLVRLQVMGLSIRDAISATSIEDYDAFMANVADTSFLSLEHDEDVIIVHEHVGADDSVIRSEKFGASDLAAAYFEQEAKIAGEMGLGS